MNLNDAALADPFEALAVARKSLAEVPHEVRRNILSGVAVRLHEMEARVRRDIARIGDDPSISAYCVTHGADITACGCDGLSLSEGEKRNAVLTSETAAFYAAAYVMASAAPGNLGAWARAWGTALGEELRRQASNAHGGGDGQCPGCGGNHGGE